jgi:hypothetical protein
MAEDDPPPQKIPLIFFRTRAGIEPVREWLKGLPEGERRAIGKDLTSAMAMAGRHAAVPPLEKRAVGSPDGPADESHRARAALFLPQASGSYQENAYDAR